MNLSQGANQNAGQLTPSQTHDSQRTLSEVQPWSVDAKPHPGPPEPAATDSERTVTIRQDRGPQPSIGSQRTLSALQGVQPHVSGPSASGAGESPGATGHTGAVHTPAQQQQQPQPWQAQPFQQIGAAASGSSAPSFGSAAESHAGGGFREPQGTAGSAVFAYGSASASAAGSGAAASGAPPDKAGAGGHPGFSKGFVYGPMPNIVQAYMVGPVKQESGGGPVGFAAAPAAAVSEQGENVGQRADDPADEQSEHGRGGQHAQHEGGAGGAEEVGEHDAGMQVDAPVQWGVHIANPEMVMRYQLYDGIRTVPVEVIEAARQGYLQENQDMGGDDDFFTIPVNAAEFDELIRYLTEVLYQQQQGGDDEALMPDETYMYMRLYAVPMATLVDVERLALRWGYPQLRQIAHDVLERRVALGQLPGINVHQ